MGQISLRSSVVSDEFVARLFIRYSSLVIRRSSVTRSSFVSDDLVALSDRALACSYRLSIVIMSLAAT